MGPVSLQKYPNDLDKFQKRCYDFRKIKKFAMKKFPTKFARYYVSEDGVVHREDDKGNVYALKPHKRGGIPKSRYDAVNISLYDENGKFQKQIRYYVHRLVAETLIENPEGHAEIDHIDMNKSNNAVSNLRWCSRKENMRYLSESYRNGVVCE